MALAKRILLILFSIAALLFSVLTYQAVQRSQEKVEAVSAATSQAVFAARSDSADWQPTLSANSLDVQITARKATGAELALFDTAAVNPGNVVSQMDAQARKIRAEKEEEKKKEEQATQQEPAARNYADDWDYPGFAGRLYIPGAGVDVALYQSTSTEVSERTDSACVFPGRPEDGGSNFVADNEVSGIVGIGVGTSAYVVTPSGNTINYVCTEVTDGTNSVAGFDSIQREDGSFVWQSAELIVYTPLQDSYHVRIACFNRA